MQRSFDPITLEILWSRLLAIVDEAATAFIQASFSTVVREAHDFSNMIMNVQGNSLAQSRVSIPSFIGTLPLTARHLLTQFPAHTLKPGDVLITNDPWKGSGHLPDVTTVSPVFYRGKLIALTGTTSHLPDIGGRLRAPESQEGGFRGGSLDSSDEVVSEGKR